MLKLDTKKSKLSFFFTVSLITIGFIFFLLRGPYLSNSIKRLIIPALENVTRERIIIDKAVINLFPFYVQAKGLKLLDKDGNRLLWVTKSRAYIDLLGLFSGELRIRKLTMIEPDVTATDSDTRRILENVKKSSSVGEQGKYRVTVKNIMMTKGKLRYAETEGPISITGSGMSLNMLTKKPDTTIKVMLKKASVTLNKESAIQGSIEGEFSINDKTITISKLDVFSSESALKANGEMNLSSDGDLEAGYLTGTAGLHTNTINKLFALKNQKQGQLDFDGTVHVKPGKETDQLNITLDVKSEGTLYLETVMEIIDVKENIAGKISVDGVISGTYPDLEGKGTALLEKAEFGSLPVDSASGQISYKKGKLSSSKFTANSYGGHFNGTAYVMIANGDYSVSAQMSDINSPEFFKFIEWDAPLQRGVVSGHVNVDQKKGKEIAVMGDLQYFNKAKSGDDLFARLDNIAANLELREGVLRLENSVLTSEKTTLLLNGTIDLNSDRFDLDMLLDSEDASDLTAPEYTRFDAPVRFVGRLEGPFNDPVLNGRLEADSGSIHGIGFDEAFADISYTMKSLKVEQLKVNQGTSVYNLSGSAEFRKAGELFDFRDPYFKAKASIQDVHVSPFIVAAYKELPITGKAEGLLSFEGDSNNYKGTADLIVSDGVAYKQPFDKIAIKSSFSPDRIEFRSIEAARGDSSADADGTLFFNEKFNLSVSSKKISLNDFPALAHAEIDATFGLNATGSGTISNPVLEYSLAIEESRFRKMDIGKGLITGQYAENKISAKGSFLEGNVTVDAGAALSDEIRWNADVGFEKGRYDSLLSGLIPDPPRDMSLSLEGGISLLGRNRTMTLNSTFQSVQMALYGYRFRNLEPVVFQLDGDELTITSFMLSADNAELAVSGKLKINQQYNLNLKGNLDIAPLKALTDKLTSIRGRGDFTVLIAGPWKSPELEGKIEVNDATAVLTESQHKIGPVYGTFRLKKDSVSFDALSVQFSGGNATLSGVGYFKDMALSELYISSDISGIRIRKDSELSAVLDGKLFYEKSSKGSSLTGDVSINKAKYAKRVEWRSWLLGLKQIREESFDYPPFLSDTVLNLNLTSDRILIDNNIARTAVKMNINVTGTIKEYGIIGRMEANQGTVFFRSNQFNVLEGSSVDFIKPNGVEPFFHILADTYASNYYVRLSLDGTVDKFELTLYSDPPLSEEEILSLLTFGQLNKEGKGIESGLAASEATALLTGSLQDEIAKEFKDITGFEQFEIEPHTTTEGAFSPRIIIGKRLLDNRIYVTYSSTVGSAEDQVIQVEYKVNENMSLIGSRNEIGSAGADVKYRIEFK